MEDAVVQVPQTRPSHASIFTGRYPYEHKIRDNYSPPLDRKMPTLATLLKTRGYATAAFIGAYPVARTSGLDQGFDLYDDPFGAGEKATTRRAAQERSAEKVADAALAWLEKPRTRPFFAWVHFFDPHAPYEAPSPFGQRFAKSPYDGEIAYVDYAARAAAGVARPLAAPRADPGAGHLRPRREPRRARRRRTHDLRLRRTLRVPLLASWPGRLPAGRASRGSFGASTSSPRLSSSLGLPAVPTSGASRSEALLKGSRIPDNESYAESLYGNLHHGWASLYSLRGEGFKFIEAPKPELYRLVDDPGETKNLVETRSAVASGMRAHLSVHRKAEGAADAPRARGSTRQHRAARGPRLRGRRTLHRKGDGRRSEGRDRRLPGLRAGHPGGPALLPRPQVRRGDPHLHRLSKATSREGTDVVQRRSFLVEYNLGRCLLETERFLEAVPHLEAAVAMDAAYVPARIFLARALGGGQRPAEALAVVDEGLATAPDNPELLHAKGSLLLRKGDLAGARIALEAAKGRDPSLAALRVDLAYLYRSLGNLPLAAAEADEAVRLDPKAAAAHVERGLVLGAQGREEEAGREFKAALEASPDQPQALYYMAAIELRGGRAAKALPLLERLRKVAPGYPGLKEALAAAQYASTSGASAPQASATGPGAFRLRLLRVADRQRAQEVERRVRAGEDFEALCSRVLGGRLGRARGRDGRGAHGRPGRADALRGGPPRRRRDDTAARDGPRLRDPEARAVGLALEQRKTAPGLPRGRRCVGGTKPSPRS